MCAPSPWLASARPPAPRARFGPWVALQLGLLASLLAACGRGASELPLDREAFARRLLSAPAVEVSAPAAWAAAAGAVVARLEAAPGPRPVATVLGAGRSGLPRLVLAPADHPLARLALEPYGFKLLPGLGFELAGRRCASPRDALIAVLRDPERPGRPLTLCVANDGAAFAEGLASQRLGLEPGLLLIRGGELEARFELADRAPRLRLSLDLAQERARTALGSARLERRGFEAYVPLEPSLEQRFEATLRRTERALERLQALGVAAPPSPPPLFLHSSGDALLRLFGQVAFVQRSPGSPYVHAWVLPTPPFDDGGAGYASEWASRSLGPPASLWIDEALGALVAGEDGESYGADLEAIAAAALRSGRVPSLEELLGDGRRIPPLWRPGLRAIVLRELLALSSRDLRDLWTGRAPLPPAAQLEERFLAALDRAAREAPRIERAGMQPLGVGAGLWLGRRDRGRAERLLSGRLFAELAALGFESVRLRVPYAERPGARAWFPPPAEAFGEGCFGDAELLGILALARSHGLRAVLELDVLSGPQGDLTAADVLASPAAWERWFDRTEAVHLHAAWLAERAGAALYSLGSDLPAATRSDPEQVRAWVQGGGPAAIEPELDLELTELRAARWRELIERLRAATGIALSFSPINDYQIEQLGFADRLDCLGVDLFGPLTYAGEASLENDDGFLQNRLQAHLDFCRREAAQRGVPLWISGLGYPRTGESAEGLARRRGATEPGIQRRVLALFQGVYRNAEQGPPAPDRAPLLGVCLWRWPILPDEREERGFLLEPHDPVVRHWLRERP